MFLINGYDCGGAAVLKIIKFASILLNIVFIVVPIGLIIMLSIDFFKNIISKQEEIQKNLTIAFKRIFMAVIIFLIPTIINFAFSILDDFDVDFASCIEIANNEDLSQYEINLSNDYDNKISDINSGSMYNDGSSTTTSFNAKTIIEKSTKWLEDTMKESGHFYVNNNPNQQYGQNGGYNCIGFVTMSWVNAGVDLDYKNYTWMKSLYDDMLVKGFKEVTDEINLDTGEGLQRGDVLIRITKINGSTHVEQYCGNGQMIGARSGNPLKGKGAYRNWSWEHVLRYTG